MNDIIFRALSASTRKGTVLRNAKPPQFDIIAVMPCHVLLALVCNVAAIRDGGADLYRAGEGFSITGHVIASNPQKRTLTFWSCPDSVKVVGKEDMLRARSDVKYRLDGHLKLAKGRGKIVVGDRLVPVETNSIPVPVDSTTAKIARGRDHASFVRVEGTVVKAAEDESDPHYCWLTLRDEHGAVSAACAKKGHPIEELVELIGAKVRIVGAVIKSVTWRENLPPRINLSTHHRITVSERAETDPEKLPDFATTHFVGRQRIEGEVTALKKDGFYMRFWRRLRDGRFRTYAFVHPAAGVALPSVGDSVVAAGFAALDGYHLHFDEALVRVKGRSARPDTAPEEISIARLFEDEQGRERLALKLHGSVVRVSGTVRDLPPVSAEGRRIVIEDDGRRIGIDAERIADAIPGWVENGAVVEATGMLQVEYERAVSPHVLPRFLRFTILPRAAGDLRLVSGAPWWTPRRLLVVILVLVGIIVWIAIWNRALKRLSVKRGEELYMERIAHKAAELKVEERTRLAIELHDSISQTLTGVALQLENGGDRSVALQMLASCRRELKNCLWDLRSRTFEEKDMTEAVRRAIGPHVGVVKTYVRFNVPRGDLSETTTHAILRIVRELVVNAVRHGRATEIRIAGERHDDTISFSVRDNGSGFDPASAAGTSSGHFGLQGIRERLNEFGGRMSIDSYPGHGTRIVIDLTTADHR